MKKNPFLVGVADIHHQPAARKREHVRAPIEGLRVTGSHVPEPGDVDLDVLLEAVEGGGILATGSAGAAWEGECRRCLRPTAGTLRAPFRELFEQDATEGESYPLRHEQVDLEPLAREVILLELPQAPLCTEDCRGLCPRCGVDLNEGECSCEPEPDPRWAALDALRTQLED